MRPREPVIIMSVCLRLSVWLFLPPPPPLPLPPSPPPSPLLSLSAPLVRLRPAAVADARSRCLLGGRRRTSHAPGPSGHKNGGGRCCWTGVSANIGGRPLVGGGRCCWTSSSTRRTRSASASRTSTSRPGEQHSHGRMQTPSRPGVRLGLGRVKDRDLETRPARGLEGGGGGVLGLRVQTWRPGEHTRAGSDSGPARGAGQSNELRGGGGGEDGGGGRGVRAFWS